MQEKYDKVFFEIYAFLVVKNLISQLSNAVKKGESPDWQDNTAGIGLEVTLAYSQHTGYSLKFAKDYLTLHENEIPTQKLENFKGYTEFRDGKLFLVSASDQTLPGNKHVQDLLDHLQIKLGKLNSPHFKVFKHNYLFEYSLCVFSENDILQFKNEMKEINKAYSFVFERVFIQTLSEVICFYENGFLERFVISRQEFEEKAKEFRDTYYLKM